LRNAFNENASYFYKAMKLSYASFIHDCLQAKSCFSTIETVCLLCSSQVKILQVGQAQSHQTIIGEGFFRLQLHDPADRL